MPLDYSKWDNLELSDDSDVEIHPNIERGTFIRLRQRKIREDREKRRVRLERAEALVAMNRDLAQRIAQLRDEVEAADEPGMEAIAAQWAQDVERSRAFKAERDAAIKDGAEAVQPTEEQMLDALKARISDDLLRAAAKLDTPEARRREYVAQLSAHIAKLQKSQQDAEREAEEARNDIARHIDPESISHSGFDRSVVTKAAASEDPKGKAKAKAKDTKTVKQTVSAVEVLNPESVGKFDRGAGGGDDDDDDTDEDDAVDEAGNLRLDSDSKEFAGLKTMEDSMDYIRKHLNIVSEEKTNQILGHAFTHELAGRKKLARQYVHQGLILTYIMELGASGVNMFAQRMGAKGPARDMFEADVDSRYKHIEGRCKVIQNESEQQADEIESIQLQTDNPDAPIRISVPDESAESAEDPERLELFRQLPEAFRDALKVGTISALNEVLATIPGPEAERILGICGQGKFLHIDEEIVVDPSEKEEAQ
ncbi:hsp90 co-chaperone Cdc37 [Coemansia javaensis]|uniref:Hsp90 chaperone protein kinase-targeting subunit n=1 Tax=Coemansia javaensis TaxID=2761396 RepID=A0A9W8HG61_9FUNG|nr:hsp90 co-chaperone Cdc37 [Coemansia javaensis]